MRLFDNDLSGYEEQKSIYPVYYREVREMDNIMEVTGNQQDRLKADYAQMLDNIYPTRADSRTTSDLEEFLRLPTDLQKPLTERRAIVQTHFLGHGHFGEPEIRDLMAAFSQGSITVDLIGGAIVLNIENLGDFNVKDFRKILEERQPAHLGLKMILTTIAHHHQYSAIATRGLSVQHATVPGVEGMYQYSAMATRKLHVTRAYVGGV